MQAPYREICRVRSLARFATRFSFALQTYRTAVFVNTERKPARSDARGRAHLLIFYFFNFTFLGVLYIRLLKLNLRCKSHAMCVLDVYLNKSKQMVEKLGGESARLPGCCCCCCTAAVGSRLL